MLWHTNLHLSVDRLIFCIFGKRSLVLVCKPLHADATSKDKRVTHLLNVCGFNTKRRSPVPIQHHASLAQLVEQWTLNPWVTGSSPVGGIILPLETLIYQRFFYFWSPFGHQNVRHAKSPRNRAFSMS